MEIFLDQYFTQKKPKKNQTMIYEMKDNYIVYRIDITSKNVLNECISKKRVRKKN